MNYLTVYIRYSSSQRAKIRRYACIHGVTTTVRVYLQKVQKHISERTVKLIRDSFHEESAK